jgi:hypothetical protein
MLLIRILPRSVRWVTVRIMERNAQINEVAILLHGWLKPINHRGSACLQQQWAK